MATARFGVAGAVLGVALALGGCSSATGTECGAAASSQANPCGNSTAPTFYCPENSTCVGSVCECNAGYQMVDCAGHPCTPGTCVELEWVCQKPGTPTGSGPDAGPPDAGI